MAAGWSAGGGRGGVVSGERRAVIFHGTPLHGVFLIEPEKRGDERGFFGRVFCDDEFAAHGLETRLVQANNSLDRQEGHAPRMRYQLPRPRR